MKIIDIAYNTVDIFYRFKNFQIYDIIINGVIVL